MQSADSSGRAVRVVTTTTTTGIRVVVVVVAVVVVVKVENFENFGFWKINEFLILGNFQNLIFVKFWIFGRIQ